MAPRTTRFLLPPKRTSSVCNNQRPGSLRAQDKGFVYRDSAGATITIATNSHASSYMRVQIDREAV